MNLDPIIQGAFLASFALFTAVFLSPAPPIPPKKSRQSEPLGLFPTAAALSLALISLHTLPQPDLNHSLEQRQTEAEEQDENGDPDDPAAQLNRQLKRIRNGENIDTLKVTLANETNVLSQKQPALSLPKGPEEAHCRLRPSHHRYK